MSEHNVTKTAGKLGVLAMLMFGFGYALIPLYNVFCEVTGLNGKTGTVSSQQVEKIVVDMNRVVTVQFDTTINGNLPWRFKSVEKKLRVHPGEVKDAVFVVENTSDRAIVGQAIPSVAPAEASIYFNKTECFCFTQQTLAPGETKEMLVRFVVGNELPDKISTMTLSYTFFMAPEDKQTADRKENTTEQQI